MVQYKFFNHKDVDSINKFLKETVIADGFSVFKFDEGILYPYEDGEGLTLIQKITNHKEERYKIEQKMDILMFAQAVLQKQVADIKQLIAKITEETERNLTELNDKIDISLSTKESYEANKLIDNEIKEVKTKSSEKIKQLENVLSQKEQQVAMNDAQATEFVDEIKMRSWVIAELSGLDKEEAVDAPEMFESKSEDGKIIVRGKSQEEADQLLKDNEEKRNKK